MYSEYDILIIDDSLYIITLLEEIIKSKGFTCKAVENISEAKEELNNHIPKLIFLDVNLPDSNGYELCKKLKLKEKFIKVLIYYFKAVAEAEVAVKALETRVDGYLKNPFELCYCNEILEHIEQKSIN